MYGETYIERTKIPAGEIWITPTSDDYLEWPEFGKA